ncbi:MAG: biotin/lipoyl-binding protein [Oscillospiraceae bacterium]|nr:biotin/lipoyl-binding protein [Oscillospiraceae bacterium]
MKRYNITVNGKTYDVEVEETGSAPSAPVQAAPAAPAPAPAAPKAATGSGTPVKAPMPGNILDVKVNVGDTVTSGQVIVILEALKMENDIVASASGKITSLNVKKGDTVNSDDVIATIGQGAVR